MNTKHILIAALLTGAFAPAMAGAAALQFHATAFASGAADDTGGPRDVERERIVIQGEDVGGAVPIGRGPLGGPMMQMHVKSIKNAPYSAEVVTEQQHNLADGNQIVNKTSSMSYRDSAGRTRQELRDASGNVRSATIHDPVEQVTYILNPQARTATKVGPHRDLARLAAQKARAATDKARANVEEARSDDGEQVIVKRIERPADGEARQRLREDVRIRVLKDIGDGPARAALERLGPLVAGAFGDMKWAAKATVTDLGTRDIEGVKAQGKLKSYEIPAGEIGNRNAIVVTTESWYSPELKVTLLNKRIDPRSGERTWRMAAIKRDEPAAALFTVPSDYAVRDVMAQLKKFEKVEQK